MKTIELKGAALDWAVAKSAKLTIIQIKGGFPYVPKYPTIGGQRFNPSTDWSQGGPIIEREKLVLAYQYVDGLWQVYYQSKERTHYGPTPLIAAMRCFVASEMGDIVEITKGLT